MGDTGWASDGATDYDGDGCRDVTEDLDDDNDGASDAVEAGAGTNPLAEHECGDSEPDSCDDCALTGDLADDGPDADPADDGPDHDGNGVCDAGDDDDDGDGVLDLADSCSQGDTGWLSETLTDYDGDGCRDATEDLDDDNDGVSDSEEILGSTDPLDEHECGDGDGDTCDDCSLTGDLNDDNPDADPTNDGPDHDGDGDCDAHDDDDDNDGISDGDDACALGDTGWVSGAATDYDGDGCRDATEDLDDDNDGASDADEASAGTNPLDEHECGDSEPDSCDDCALTGDLLDDGPDADPTDDGPDIDGDNICDAGDVDDDGDGVINFIDDCPQGDAGWTSAPGTDYDDDGCRDATEDLDDDNDGVSDSDEGVAGTNPLDEHECGDGDADTCDDCSVSGDLADDGPDADPADDGPDYDSDGDCDAGDGDDDNDGVSDGVDTCATGATGWTSEAGTDHDSDGCRDSDEDDDDDGDGILDGDDLCATGETGWLSTPVEDADGDGCRGATEDCDDASDTGATCATGCTPYYRDSDGDAHGDLAAPLDACSQPSGYVPNSDDCDDVGPCGSACAPDLPEDFSATNCDDGFDNDCDELVDTADPTCAGHTDCHFIAWAAQYRAPGTSYTLPDNLVDSAPVGATFSQGDWDSATQTEVYDFDASGQTGSISRVELVLAYYLSGALGDDYLELQVVWQGTDQGTPVTLGGAELNGQIGAAAAGFVIVDVSSARSPWSWSDFGTDLEARLLDVASGGSDSITISVDAVGFRVTYGCNTPPVARFRVDSLAGDTTTTFNLDADAPAPCDAACQAACAACDATCEGTCDAEDDTAALEVRWDCAGTGSFTPFQPSLTGACSYSNPGVYVIVMEVRDSRGVSGFATRVVAVRSLSAATHVVTSGASDGLGSLNQAIKDLGAGGDQIIFDSAVATITLTGNLSDVNVPATIIADGNVTLDGNTHDCFEIKAGPSLIAGLRIINCNNNGVKIGSPAGGPVTIRDCVIDNSKDAGVLVDNKPNHTVGPGNLIINNGKNGVTLNGGGCDNTVVRGNEIRANIENGISLENGNTGVVIEDNFIHANGLNGISAGDDCSTLRIERNEIWNHDYALRVGRNSTGGLLRFNTLVLSTNSLVFFANATITGWDIRNNIFADAGAFGLAPSGAVLAEWSYNLFSANASGPGDGCGAGNNAALLDPLFADRTGGDFRLQGGSPAIDTALDLSVDVNGPAAGDYNGAAPDRGGIESP